MNKKRKKSPALHAGDLKSRKFRLSLFPVIVLVRILEPLQLALLPRNRDGRQHNSRDKDTE
ncbi:hypothetical protein [Alistipes sp.]|uniref:hypothetical protein n=1 Tax=Alistipes sp. TaxID=1872444 RepID=UPI0025C1446D|nr:hypothetical protein [Alistipes sp.]